MALVRPSLTSRFVLAPRRPLVARVASGAIYTPKLFSTTQPNASQKPRNKDQLRDQPSIRTTLRDNAKMYEEADMIMNMTNTKGFWWAHRFKYRIRAMLETTESKEILDHHRAEGMSEAEIQKKLDGAVEFAVDMFILSLVLAAPLIMLLQNAHTYLLESLDASARQRMNKKNSEEKMRLEEELGSKSA